ncbi:MAG: hypothetical protein WEB00_02515 [Dehalococcoidia bacterium]
MPLHRFDITNPHSICDFLIRFAVSGLSLKLVPIRFAFSFEIKASFSLFGGSERDERAPEGALRADEAKCAAVLQGNEVAGGAERDLDGSMGCHHNRTYVPVQGPPQKAPRRLLLS